MMRCVHTGAGRPQHRRATAQDLGVLIRDIRARGYDIGCVVRIGAVRGTVLGYNIARRGKFRGAAFPLVVQTPFGVAKCSTAEVELA